MTHGEIVDFFFFSLSRFSSLQSDSARHTVSSMSLVLLGIAIRFLPLGSLFVELIAFVKRGMDVLKFFLWRMTPCGFLAIKAAEESDTSIFRVEETFSESKGHLIWK
jgi:hypothetical protein